MIPRRHDWVYLDPATLPAMRGADAASGDWVRSWIGRSGPLVVTRQTCPDGQVSLGAVLPIDHGRVRVACTVDSHAIVRCRGPVTVDEAVTVLPLPEAAALTRLAREVAGHASELGVFGSTAWEYFSAQRYRHPLSDIDTICDVDSSHALAACLEAFAEAARYFPSRIDGELRLAGAHAVAWRELQAACRGSASSVLAKGERELALLPLRQLLAELR